jgi:hypothetical protein
LTRLRRASTAASVQVRRLIGLRWSQPASKCRRLWDPPQLNHCGMQVRLVAGSPSARIACWQVREDGLRCQLSFQLSCQLSCQLRIAGWQDEMCRSMHNAEEEEEEEEEEGGGQHDDLESAATAR